MNRDGVLGLLLLVLADPAYRAIYTANGLQPGYLSHDAYVRFMDDFVQQTQGFLRESGVIN